MKFFVTVLLALAVQAYARSTNSWDSSEEKYDHRQSESNNDQKELNELVASRMRASSAHWNSSAAALPDASLFRLKISRRINNSRVLADDTEMQQNIYKVAEEKLQKCEKPNGQELDKHCVGRTIGQVMQMIAALENDSRRA